MRPETLRKTTQALDWLFSPENHLSPVPFHAWDGDKGLTILREKQQTIILITSKNQTIMANYSKTSVAQDARVELHDVLNLTGAEVSINNLPAGAGVPFVHSHKQNEEIYAILSGKGRAEIEGETIKLVEGDWLRIAPSAKRQFFAAEDSAISYICIQVKANSLEGYTMTDAIV